MTQHNHQDSQQSQVPFAQSYILTVFNLLNMPFLHKLRVAIWGEAAPTQAERKVSLLDGVQRVA